MYKFYKQVAVTVSILLIATSGYTQSIDRSVLGSAGGYSAITGGPSLAYNMGETFVATLQNGSAMLTEGFEQDLDGSPLPAITGGSTLCAGTTITLTDATAGGRWSSSDATIAGIDTIMGVVTGVAAGAATITYTASGAYTTLSITVNPSPTHPPTIACSIGGTAFCAFSFYGVYFYTYDGGTGGIWSSVHGNVTLDSEGFVTAAIPATTDVIQYTTTNACGTSISTFAVTLDSFASAGLISGPTPICNAGGSIYTTTGYGGHWSCDFGYMESISVGVGDIYSYNLDNNYPFGGTVSYTVDNTCASGTTNFGVTIDDANPYGYFYSNPVSIEVCPGAPVNAYTNSGYTVYAWDDAYSENSYFDSLDYSYTFHKSGSEVTTMRSGEYDHAFYVTITNSCGLFSLPISIVVDSVPNPGIITGATTLRNYTSITLTDTATFGAWSSSNPSIASVSDASIGVITGVSTGVDVISYTIDNSFDYYYYGSNFCSLSAYASITVLPNHQFINGTTQSMSVCGSGNTQSINSLLQVYDTDTGNTVTWSVVTPPAQGTLAAAYTTTSTGGTLTPTGLYYTSTSATFTAHLNDTFSVQVTDGTYTDVTTVYVTLDPAVIYGQLELYHRPSYDSFYFYDSYFDVYNICNGTALIAGAQTSDSLLGGIWSIDNTAIATLSDTPGLYHDVVVHGNTVGTTSITFTQTNSCGAHIFTKNISVHPSASPIIGANNVCSGSSLSLSDTTAGGVWSSNAPWLAPVYGSGNVIGVNAGTAQISYTIGIISTIGASDYFEGCSAIDTVLVKPSDAGYINASGDVCVGTSATLSATYPGGKFYTYDTYVATLDSNTGLITGLADGSATVYYTYTNSCGTYTASKNVIIGNYSGTIYKDDPVICQGNNTHFYNFSAPGGAWSSASTGIATINPVTGLLSGIGGGVATISYTLTRSCGTLITTSTITINPLPNPGVITGINSLCPASSIALTDTTTGGFWNSADNTVAVVSGAGEITGIAAGTATISYFKTNGCGTTAATFNVIVFPILTASSITGTAIVCAGGATTTLANAQAGGVWSSVSTTNATINSSGVVTGLAAGNSIISYTIANYCGSATATTTVTVNPLPATPLPISGTAIVCAGATTTFTNTVSGGIWTSSNTSMATIDATTGIVSALAAGNTTISYTISNSCGSNTVTKTLTVNPLPATPSAISGATVLCATSTTTLSNTVTGGTWASSNSSIATIDGSGVVYGNAAGNATITYTITNSCGTAFVTSNITVNPLPASPSAISGTAIICVGATSTLANTVSGGTWASSNTSIATIDASTGIVSALAAGNSTISYTITNSCGSNTVTKIVTVNPLPATPSTISGATVLCATSTTTLSNTVSGGAWASSNTAVATIDGSGVVSGIMAGSATISYTITNSCGSAFVTSSITVNPMPNAGTIAGTTHVCAGANTTFTDGVSGGTWSSSNTSLATIDGTGTVTGVMAGIVSISYTYTNSCGTAITSTPITINPLAAIPSVVSGTNLIVAGTTTTLTDSVSGGVWSSSNSSIATINSVGIVTGVGAGNTTISYTISNSCNSATAVFSLSVLSTIHAIAGSNSACIGGTTTLTDSTTGGIWNSSNTAIATVSSTGVVTGVAIGSVLISYTIGGATVSTTILVSSSAPSPSPISGSSIICNGTTTTLINSLSGGSWTSSNTAKATVTSGGVVTAIATGTVIITYSVTNACGTGIATMPITINTSPNTIAGTTLTCIGKTVTLIESTSGGTWSSSNTTSATVTSSGIVSALAAGTPVISYTLSNGCYKTITETITPTPSAITGSSAICVGTTTTLTDAFSSGTWSTSNSGFAPITTSGVVSGNIAGTATISYTLGSCTATLPITINATPSPITGSLAVCSGKTTTLGETVSGGTWISSDTTLATVNISGVVTGMGLVAGNPVITYTLGGSCYKTAVATVNPMAAITGSNGVCLGNVISLSDVLTGGTWSTSNNSFAPITTGGVVSGNIAGNATISYTIGMCSAILPITVYALPAPITGVAMVCSGNTVALGETVVGGTWNSSNTALATVNSSGVVTGVGAGNPVITYTVAGGCYKTVVETVNPAAAISGSGSICLGSVATLTNAVSGGTWSTSNSGFAPITTGGVVTASVVGNATISYTVGSCISTLPLTINTTPNAITGAGAICGGISASLTETTTGGGWSSSDITLATVNTSGVVTGVAMGNPVISYTLGNGCYKTVIETVNATPAAIGGSATICAGTVATLTDAVSGGTWSTSNSGYAPISTSGIVTGSGTGTATITYTIGSCKAILPITVNANALSVITGVATVCTGSSLTVADATAGGTWSINNTALATINASTGVVTGVGAGSAIVTYSLSGCYKTATIPVNGTFPAAISGAGVVCVGATTNLTDLSISGTWSSSNTSVAQVTTTGVVSGVGAGVANIFYTVNACAVTLPVTVNANTISGIYGTPLGGVCLGNTITMQDATVGGSWAINDVSIGTINASTGVLTGVSVGLTSVTYTVGSCYKTLAVGVGTPVASIAGATAICTSTPATLTDATTGGNWYSSATARATVIAGGIVTGVAAGTATISYVKYGCVALHPVTVNVCREGNEPNQPSVTNGEVVIDYTLYPNPSTGLINIVQSLPSDLTTEVRVMNYVGQTVFAGSIEFTGGKSQISLAGAVPGIYLIELNEGKGKMATFRVVIEK